MSNSVTILDYGIGNILSVARGFEAIGADVNIKSNIEGIKNADRLILPGVGAFASGIEQLKVNNGEQKDSDKRTQRGPSYKKLEKMDYLEILDNYIEYPNKNLKFTINNFKLT